MASDPAGPRITYYDDASGERIELSTATLVNWAAKTGNLLRDEMGAGPSSRVAVLLPAHWQTAAVLFGIWWIGAEVVTAGEADVALCTADRLAEADDAVGVGEIAVLSLDPFGKPVPDLPVGLTDYATAVRVHGDQIVPERAPGTALDGRSVTDVLTQAQASAGAQGFVRARPGPLEPAMGHRRRDDCEPIGCLHRRRIACAGGESGCGTAGSPPADGEGHPGLKWREQTQKSPTRR